MDKCFKKKEYHMKIWINWKKISLQDTKESQYNKSRVD